MDTVHLADVRAVDKQDSVSKVMGWLLGESSKRPVIMDGKVPYAIVNTRQLMARGIHDRTGVHKVALPVPTMKEDDAGYRAIEAFADSLVPYLPVVDAQGRLLGALTAEACLADLPGGPSAKHAGLSSVSVRDSDDVDVAMHAFAKTWDAQLPVLDDQGRLVGVLDRASALRLHDFQETPPGRKDFGGERMDLRENKVADWMEAGWNVIAADASFDDMVESLQQSGYAFVEDAAGRYMGTATAPGVIRSVVQAPAGTVSLRAGT